MTPSIQKGGVTGLGMQWLHPLRCLLLWLDLARQVSGLDGEDAQSERSDDCGSNSRAIGCLCNYPGSPGASTSPHWTSLSSSARSCESSPGHRILEQATRGSLRPKCLKEAAGRVFLASAYLIAGRIGAQHEPSVTGPLLEHRFAGQG